MKIAIPYESGNVFSTLDTRSSFSFTSLKTAVQWQDSLWTRKARATARWRAS